MPEAIFEDGPVDTPYVYTVSGTGTVTPRACAAVYNGSGAGGAFIPAVIFRSLAGNVIARATLDSTIKAGDDAEISWFRGVKHAAAAATSTTLPAATASILETQANFPAGTFAPNIDTFRTNTAGASVFSVNPLNLFECIVHEQGMYLITGGWSCSSFATELRNASILTAIGGGINLGGSIPQQELAGQNVVSSAQANLMTFAGLLGFNAGDFFYQYFSSTKALSGVGPMGWTIQKISADLVT